MLPESIILISFGQQKKGRYVVYPSTVLIRNKDRTLATESHKEIVNEIIKKTC